MKMTLHIWKYMNDFCLICDERQNSLKYNVPKSHEIKALKKEVNYPEIY